MRSPNDMSVTRLPGGARITLKGYLPDKTCARCGVIQIPTEFFDTWKYHDGCRVLSFGNICLICEPPPRKFPRDLHGMRITATFLDDHGRTCGWYQRDKQRGIFGPELSLETMQFRKVSGVFRPQPKLLRCSEKMLRGRTAIVRSEMLAHPPVMIYFKQERRGMHRIKIGKTTTNHRLRQTRSTDSAEETVTAFSMAERPGFTEKDLHWRFRKHRIDREWFWPADEILTFIDHERYRQQHQQDSEGFKLT